MLTLSRKKNEGIVIDNDITVEVVDIWGDKVRLSIVAPEEVPIHRREVFDAIQEAERERHAAAGEAVASPLDAFFHGHYEGRMGEFARFILGVGTEPRPASSFWAHLRECLPCRQALQSAIAGITLS